MALRENTDGRVQSYVGSAAAGDEGQVFSATKVNGRGDGTIQLPATSDTKAGGWFAPWREVAAAYATLSGTVDPSIVALRLSDGDVDALADALTAGTQGFRAGDVVALDVAGKTARRPQGVTRDELGRALFKAGLENSLAWTGREVLREEHRAVSMLGAFLP